MVVLSIGAKTQTTTSCKLPYDMEAGVYEMTQSWCHATEGVHLLKFKSSGGKDLFPSGRAVTYTSKYTAAGPGWAGGWSNPQKHESTVPISSSGDGVGTKKIGLAHAEQVSMDTDDEVHEVQLELTRADGSAVTSLEEWGVTLMAPPVRI